MAGLNVGTSNWGSFRGSPETEIPKPPQQSQRRGRWRGRGEGVDTGPTKLPPPIPMGGGMNVGRGSISNILPSPMDPFRTYGTVQGGRVTPPANPYGQNQPIRFTPGGEYGPGPIQTGPSQNPYLNRGGFTGMQMPPNVDQANIPNMGQGGNMFGGGFGGGLRNAYRGGW